MDQTDVETMKLTKYGFQLNMIKVITFLSVFGIITSILLIILAGVAANVIVSLDLPEFQIPDSSIYCGIGAIIIFLIIPYLLMWILLSMKAKKKDITSIERIANLYSYVSGALEICGMIFNIYREVEVAILSSPNLPLAPDDKEFGVNWLEFIIAKIICWLAYLIFICLKIYGTEPDQQKNRMLGTYIGFRYALFITFIIVFFIMSTCISYPYAYIFLSTLIGGILFFILDIGLNVILHSIREDRGNFDEIENSFLNEWIE